MAKRVKRCLEEGKEDEAIEIVLRNNDVLKWRNGESHNETLMHNAADLNRNLFLEAVFNDEKVVTNF